MLRRLFTFWGKKEFTPEVFIQQNPGNLVAWYDASDYSTFSFWSGNSISQWRDKSGYNNHVNHQTTIDRPSYSATGMGGYPTVQFVVNNYAFPGTPSDPLHSQPLFGTISQLANQQNITFFAVLFAEDGAFVTSWLSSTLKHPPTPGIWWSLGAGRANGIFYGSDQNWGLGSSNAIRLGSGLLRPYQTPYQTVYQKTPSQWLINVNGSLVSTVSDASYPTGAFKLLLGRANSDDNQQAFYGRISEILIVRGSISNKTKQDMEGYLAVKWGLTSSLPSGHPYKNA